MKNAVNGFHHIAIKASDFDKSLAFYKELGLVERVRWGEGDNRAVMLNMGDGGLIELFAGGSVREKTADEANEHWMHLALKVDDVEYAYTTALDAGATARTAPMIVSPEGSEPAMRMHIAFVYGPDGEIIEFFKELI